MIGAWTLHRDGCCVRVCQGRQKGYGLVYTFSQRLAGPVGTKSAPCNLHCRFSTWVEDGGGTDRPQEGSRSGHHAQAKPKEGAPQVGPQVAFVEDQLRWALLRHPAFLVTHSRVLAPRSR